MASLQDIRKRIKSVKGTQKITKAMKMVSAAKLRRAQQNVEASRPYTEKIIETVSILATQAEKLGEVPHPLLGKTQGPGNVEILLLSSDRGLCGGFNSNAVRKILRFNDENKDKFNEIKFSVVGKKGLQLLSLNQEINSYYEDFLSTGDFAAAQEIADSYCERYIKGELDTLYVYFNAFKGEAQMRQLLPIVPAKVEGDLLETEFQPSRDELLSTLLPIYFAMQLYNALLENIAAEHLARMLAMDSATSNAGEMVDKLTLIYNRARQAAITTELGEIISGAEALK